MEPRVITTRVTGPPFDFIIGPDGRKVTKDNIGGHFTLNYKRPDAGYVTVVLHGVNEIFDAAGRPIKEYIFVGQATNYPDDMLLSGGDFGCRSHLDNCDLADPMWWVPEGAGCCPVPYTGENPNLPDGDIPPDARILLDRNGSLWVRTQCGVDFAGPFRNCKDIVSPVSPIMAALAPSCWTSGVGTIKPGANTQLVRLSVKPDCGECDDEPIWTGNLPWADDAALQALLNDPANGVPFSGDWTVENGRLKVCSNCRLFSMGVSETALETTETFFFTEERPEGARPDLVEALRCALRPCGAAVVSESLEPEPEPEQPHDPEIHFFSENGQVPIPEWANCIRVGGVGAPGKQGGGQGGAGSYGEFQYPIDGSFLKAGDTIIVPVGEIGADARVPSGHTGFFKLAPSKENALLVAPAGGAGGNSFDCGSSNVPITGTPGGSGGPYNDDAELQGTPGSYGCSNGYGTQIYPAGGSGWRGGIGGKGGEFYFRNGHKDGSKVELIGPTSIIWPEGHSEGDKAFVQFLKIIE